MRYTKILLAAVIGAMGAPMAVAAPTADEAAQLGKTLTPLGAIKAGNKDGTIPEWTGGVCTPPAGYKPAKGLQAGGGPYVNPFEADKPLFKITAANMAQYADKLDEGTKELLRRNPQTFYIPVYPTHRSACFPAYAYENTIKNVMRPRIVGGDAPSLTDAHAQYPFPIPKTGVEAMWNQQVSFRWPSVESASDTWMVDSSGNNIWQTTLKVWQAKPYWDNSLTKLSDDQPQQQTLSSSTAPPNQAGTLSLRWNFTRMDLKGAPVWSYTPGQRRVRLAPELSYDAVSSFSGGLLLYDEISGYDGVMDRFDFKLKGRKEMYIPYNSYELAHAPAKVNTPNHIDPAVLRYELHRVWEVEATLKPGERHVQSKKVFYIDEDSWFIMLYNGFDQSGKIHHVFFNMTMQEYDKPMIGIGEYHVYDFSRRAYIRGGHSNGIGQNRGEQLYGSAKTPPRPRHFYTAESMAGMGVR